MMTVKEVSKLTGVSVRALRYYDKLGLLVPATRTESGYRLYDDASLERLQQVLLFRELEFPLKDIAAILDSPCFDRKRALEQQITLLTMKKEHIENLITLAQGIKLRGVNYMDFKAFDAKKIDEYTKQAKETWGGSPLWTEFEEKAKSRTKKDDEDLAAQCMDIFTGFGSLKDLPPDDPKVTAQVKTLQSFITANFYKCTDKILLSLGKMYAGGGEFTENIDNAGGEGTANFTLRAIECAVNGK